MKRSSDSLRTRTSRRRWIRAISTSISSGDIVLSAIDTSEWPERKREGRQTEEKQCNKRRQTYKTFLNHSFIHSGHSFTVQPCPLGLNYREQVLHMAYFHWPHLIKALKCKILIPLIWCHMCIGKFTPFVSSLKTFSYRQLGKLTSHLLWVWHVISLHPRAWYLVRKRCG